MTPFRGGGPLFIPCAAHRPPHQKGGRKSTRKCKSGVRASIKVLCNKAPGAGCSRHSGAQTTCKTCSPRPPQCSPAQHQTSENQRSERPWTPQRAHEAPQRFPTGSKTCPREPQKRPRGAKRRSRAPKSRPRAAQEGPRPVQNRVRRAFRSVFGTIFVGSSVRTALESILLRFLFTRNADDV